jgi:hypothetical protein
MYNALEMAQYLEQVKIEITSFQRQFGEIAGVFAPLPISFEATEVFAESHTNFKARIDGTREAIISAGKQFDEATSHLANVRYGLTALNAGYTIKPGQFGLDECDLDGATNAYEAAKTKYKCAREFLDLTTIPLQQRLQSAFTHLIKNKELNTDLQALRLLSTFFQDQRENIVDLFELYQQFTFIIGQDEINSPKRDKELNKLTDEIQAKLNSICESAKSVAVPFARKVRTPDAS